MVSPRPPQQLRAKRTRRELLTAASRVFGLNGYEGATVDDIAQAAGCSKGAYYFHFASKEQVLLALVDEWVRARSEALAKAAGGPASEALRRMLTELFVLEDGWEPQVLLGFWAQAERKSTVRRKLLDAQRVWRRSLTSAFERAQEVGALPAELAPDGAAALALALHDGLIVEASLGLPARASSKALLSAVQALLGGPATLRRAG